jgi:drug/metabolite transporter (DMT)-like permease
VRANDARRWHFRHRERVTSVSSAQPAQATSRGWTAHAGLLIVQLCFASQAVESKWAMMPIVAGGAGMPPYGVAMWRMLGATVFFQLLSVVMRKAVPGLRDQAKLAGLSLLGIVLNQMLFLKGLQKTTPATAALLAVTIPASTFAISALVGRERPTVRALLGLLCAGLGVLVLTGIRTVDEGALLIAVNCSFYGAYVVFSRELVQRLSAFTVVTWIFTWGMVLFAPFGVGPMTAMVQTAHGWGVLFLVYVVLVPTVIAYWINAWALGRTSASLVTIYVLLQPLIAAALAYAQLGTPLVANFMLSGALITAGLVLVAARRSVGRA